MSRTRPIHAQSGGITILVALMLLVLLTIAAVGMSRNSFREVVSSGTSRQGAMVRNTADAGIEWSIYWMDLNNGAGAADSALKLQALKRYLLEHEESAGRPYDLDAALYDPANLPKPSTLAADQKVPNAAGNLQGFSVGVTRMGKLPITDTSQGITQGTFAPSQGQNNKTAPYLWAVRSDAQLQVGTGLLAPVFVHSKEAWISTPVQ